MKRKSRRSKQAEECIARGIAFFQKGEFDKAIAEYNEAIKRDAESSVAYNNRGIAYSRKGCLDKAIEDFNEAIRLKPDYALAHCNRGIAYIQKGDRDKALVDLFSAINDDHKMAIAYHYRGVVFFEDGDYDKAIKDFNKVIDLDREFAPTYLYRGLAYKGKGYHDDAIKDFNKAIELDSKLASENNVRRAVEESQALKRFNLSYKSQERLIGLLSRRATGGDIESFAVLVQLAQSAVVAINRLTKTNVSEAREVARRHSHWPILLSHSERDHKEARNLLKRLKLGEDPIVPLDVRRSLRKADVPKKIAIHLVFFMTDLRRFAEDLVTPPQPGGFRKEKLKFTPAERKKLKSLFESKDLILAPVPDGYLQSAIARLDGLAKCIAIPGEKWREKPLRRFVLEVASLPSLTANTWESWVEVGKNVIMFLTDDHPESENYPVLRRLGLYRKNAYYRKQTDKKSPAEIEKIRASRLAAKTEEDDIRDGIFTKIRSAFKAVVKEMDEDQADGGKSSPESLLK